MWLQNMVITSPINRSARVYLNRGDIKSVILYCNIKQVLINFKAHGYILLCSFLIPRVFYTFPEIRDWLLGNFYLTEFYFSD